jgi:hypothetical protein
MWRAVFSASLPKVSNGNTVGKMEIMLYWIAAIYSSAFPDVS